MRSGARRKLSSLNIEYSYFDFLFCLDEVETSIINFEPQYLKNKFEYLEEKLKSKKPFPIEKFHDFADEDIIDLNFLHVNLKGKYLNKIVNLILKSPHEHFFNLFSNLIRLFDECIKRDLKLKAHVSC